MDKRNTFIFALFLQRLNELESKWTITWKSKESNLWRSVSKGSFMVPKETPSSVAPPFPAEALGNGNGSDTTWMGLRSFEKERALEWIGRREWEERGRWELSRVTDEYTLCLILLPHAIIAILCKLNQMSIATLVI